MILAIETSTPLGSMALGDGCGADPLWRQEFATGRGRGGAAFEALSAALAFLGEEKLAGIVVGLGPGSYSGVRLAVAAVAGLGLARGIVPRGRPSVEALGTDAAGFHAVGDARRGGFYYAAVRGGRCEREPELLDAAAVRARVAAAPAGWLVLAGEAAPALGDLGLTVAVCPPDAARLWRGFAGLPAPAVPLEPIYLRPPAITMPKA